ncbi:MAG: AbrB/MazE/SpoVT family DNA-binding domain-containing protein [Proteobacteria bacterium]|nr:AbrB/MazE/SpoVT family DNA-binding domain-containing protein [Pseudomonadota bacterium]
MPQPLTVKVSSRHQIALPSVARRQLNIQPGDRLLVDVQDGILLLFPQPNDYVGYMAGLHKKVWKDIDTADYLDSERNAWQQTKTPSA